MIAPPMRRERTSRGRRRAVLAVAALLVAAPAPTAAAPAVSGEFDLGGNTPHHLTRGPDGNIWVALDGTTDDLARVAPDGTVTRYNPANVTGPVGIAAGPDGNLWVTQAGGVARFSPADPNGAQAFAIAAITDPRGITAGPDGNLWTASGDQVVRIPPANPAGFVNFTVPGLGARGIAAGSDGRLWVADFAGGGIVSVTTEGTPTPHAVGGNPQEVAGGPGGQVAYSNPGTTPQTLGRLVQGGSPLTTPVGTSDPFGIVYGPDGAYWTAQFATNDLGRLTRNGTYSTLGGFSANAGPRYLTAGPGNTLWVGLETAKKVARVSGVEPPAQERPPAGPGPGGSDVVRPVLSRLTLSPSRFRVGRADTPRSAQRRRRAGTIVRFRLSEPATVRLLVQRPLPGRLVGGRCVAPRRGAGAGRRCRRWRTVLTLTREGRQGRNRVRFSGRSGKRVLRPGRYRLAARATDAAGNRGREKRRAFRVLAPR